jgi:membrane protease YdiL (CAAX protease family)
MVITKHNAFGAPAPRLGLVSRLLSYLVCFIVVNLLANIARVGVQMLGAPALIGRLVFTLLYITGIIGLTSVYRHSIDRRPWQGMALPPLRKRWLDVTVGVGSGLLLVILIFELEVALGWIAGVGYARDASALTLLVDSLLVSLAFGVCEEVCFRGYLFQNLSESGPLWRATLITGLLFGVIHLLEVGFGTRGLTYFLFIVLLHIFLVSLRLWTGSLWWGIGFHTAFDWLAINVGLGTVVLAERPLLSLTRTASLLAEDGLSMAVLGLALLLFLSWAERKQRTLSWRTTLAENGQVQTLTS